MTKLILFISMLACTCPAFSQWERQSLRQVQELTREVKELYRAEYYRLDFVTNIYLAEGDTVFQHQQGRLLKGPGVDYALYSDEATLIQENGLKVMYYPKNGTVYLMDSDSIVPLMDFADTIEKAENYDFFRRQQGSLTVLKAVSKFPSETMCTELYIENGRLTKTMVYFTPQNYVQASRGDQSVERPYMEIIYAAPLRLTPEEKVLLRASKYVYASNGRYYLSGDQNAKSQLIDLRVPQSNTSNR